MKVNVIGKFPGQTVNGIGVLPMRGVELTEAEVMRLLNFSNIRVFDAENGGLLTKGSFTAKKKPAPKPAAAPAPIVEQKAPDLPAVEEPVFEVPTYVPPEATIEEKVEEPVVEETPVVEEVVEEAAPAVEETVTEEKPVEEKPYQKYNKNKGKNNKKRFDNRDQAADKE